MDKMALLERCEGVVVVVVERNTTGLVGLMETLIAVCCPFGVVCDGVARW